MDFTNARYSSFWPESLNQNRAVLYKRNEAYEAMRQMKKAEHKYTQ